MQPFIGCSTEDGQRCAYSVDQFESLFAQYRHLNVHHSRIQDGLFSHPRLCSLAEYRRVLDFISCVAIAGALHKGKGIQGMPADVWQPSEQQGSLTAHDVFDIACAPDDSGRQALGVAVLLQALPPKLGHLKGFETVPSGLCHLNGLVRQMAEFPYLVLDSRALEGLHLCVNGTITLGYAMGYEFPADLVHASYRLLQLSEKNSILTLVS